MDEFLYDFVIADVFLYAAAFRTVIFAAEFLT